MVPATDRPTGEQPTQPVWGVDKVIKLSVRVFEKHDYVYAECLDLSLIARRDTVDDALRALYDQIHLYVTDVLASGDWDQAMHRSASLDRWALFYADLIVDVVSRLAHRDFPDSAFRMPFDRTGHIAGAGA